ncbi:PAS domain-containing sensor histidine kinase [Alphaproteobacteria bacterium]|nr:PAS domain-containing sensor histidine kinase [Alphaproteobacteria bacterium]
MQRLSVQKQPSKQIRTLSEKWSEIFMTAALPSVLKSFKDRLLHWFRFIWQLVGHTVYTVESWFTRAGLTRRLSSMLVILSIGMGLLTFLALTQQDIQSFHPKAIRFIFNIDLVVLFIVFLVITRRLIQLWRMKRRGAAGAILHTRLVVLFSIITVLPAVTMGLLMTIFFHAGVESWFDHKVKTAVSESRAVADAYLAEHTQSIRNTTDAMARAIDKLITIGEQQRRQMGIRLEDDQLPLSAEQLHDFVDEQSRMRGLTEALIFDSSTNVIARSKLTFALDFQTFNDHEVQQAKSSVITQMSPDGTRVRAMTMIDEGRGLYLLVGRPLDPQILKRITQTKEAVDVYTSLEEGRSAMSVQLALMFGLITLLLLMGAILVGLLSAKRLASPIASLINAADQISHGNLKARVDKTNDWELGSLSSTFNNMALKLQRQQHSLMRKNKTLDQRRQFIEAIFEGVSSGVINIDIEGRIGAINVAACQILRLPSNPQQNIGKPLTELFPECNTILKAMSEGATTDYQEQIRITRQNHPLDLMMRIVSVGTDQIDAHIITIENITNLVTAQRQAAWANVARRVAHEIKNPLTPIQLSAERLHKKFLPQIREEAPAFERCINTITRQVQHMGTMVREFSDFARLPAPQFKKLDLVKVIRENLSFFEQAHPLLTFHTNFPKTLSTTANPEQLGQVLTNLIQNSLDAMREQENSTIWITLSSEKNRSQLIFEDNGPGFPPEHLHQLTEPYITHKESGTGLGLAIVRKIVEDHKGTLSLENGLHGAKTTILLRHEDPAK